MHSSRATEPSVAAGDYEGSYSALGARHPHIWCLVPATLSGLQTSMVTGHGRAQGEAMGDGGRDEAAGKVVGS